MFVGGFIFSAFAFVGRARQGREGGTFSARPRYHCRYAIICVYHADSALLSRFAWRGVGLHLLLTLVLVLNSCQRCFFLFPRSKARRTTG